MAKSLILDQQGNPFDVADLTQEIAAPALTSVRQLYPDTFARGMTPERLIAILDAAAKNSIRDYLTLAEEMEELDPHYFSVLGKRKLKVRNLPTVVTPASESQRDLDIAQGVRDMLSLECVKSSQADLLDGLGKGFSVSEIVWEYSEGQLQPKQVIHRDPRWFRFDIVDRTTLRLLDEKDPAFGIPLQKYKFLKHLPKLKTGIPIRSGLARMIGVTWMMSAFADKDWMAFAEVFGMPLRVGKYPATATPKDVSILKRAVANIGTDAAAVIPQSMMIEFVQGSASAGGDTLFERLSTFLDKRKSKLVLGETMTTDDGSSRAQGQVHENVNAELADDDGEQLAATYVRDLVQAWVDLNYGPQKKYPGLTKKAVQKEDVGLLVDKVVELVPMGLEVSMNVLRDKLGLPAPKPGEVLLTAPAAAPPPDDGDELETGAEPFQRANNRAGRPRTRSRQQTVQDQVDLTRAADQLSDPALIQSQLGRLQALIEDSGDYDAFSRGLQELAAGASPEAFVEAMANAGFAAHLAGRTPGA
jgi:phage gp29-like protein